MPQSINNLFAIFIAILMTSISVTATPAAPHLQLTQNLCTVDPLATPCYEYDSESTHDANCTADPLVTPCYEYDSESTYDANCTADPLATPCYEYDSESTHDSNCTVDPLVTLYYYDTTTYVSKYTYYHLYPLIPLVTKSKNDKIDQHRSFITTQT